MIKIQDVCKTFGSHEALKHINLEIESGETIAIIGGSGSGKSTLLRLLVGLDKPTSGEIYIMGQPISHMGEKELDKLRMSMGMVFQYSALFDSMTVGDNVAFGLREHTALSEAEIKAVVAKKLEQVGLPGIEAAMPGELSGGMKKRVGLARAIAFDPKIIFYDEPSSGLDPIMTAKIDELIIETQQKQKATSVVVTHDMVSACTIADRIAMIYEGELIALDTPERFPQIQDDRVQAFLQRMNAGQSTGKADKLKTAAGKFAGEGNGREEATE